MIHAFKVSIKGTFLISILASLVIGCSTDDPVATQYKQNVNSSDQTSNQAAQTDEQAEQTGDEDSTVDENQSEEEAEEVEQAVEEDPAAVQAALVEAGTNIYNQRCADCHGELANSARANRTSQQILGAAGNQNHNAVQWPNQEESLALQAALQR